MRGVLFLGLAQVPGGLPIPVHSPVPLCAKTAEFAYPGPQTRQGIVTIRTDGLQPSVADLSAVYVDLEYLAGGYGNVTVLVHHGAGDGSAANKKRASVLIITSSWNLCRDSS